MTGWRLGYVIAPKEVINNCKKVHDFLTVGAAAPLQRAAIVGLNYGDDYYKEVTKLYTKKRDLFLNGLDTIGLKYYKPQGAYYVMVNIDEFGVKSDEDFAVDLIKKIGVASVPGSSFFKEDINSYIRFHFAKSESVLESALEKLSHIHEYF